MLRADAVDRRAFLKVAGSGLVLALCAGALPGCSGVQNMVGRGREFTDDMGRTLTIPSVADLKKVYFTSGLAEVFCFTLNSDILAGTALKFTEEDLEHLPANMADLVYMGSLSEDGEINRELLMAEGVQLVFSISAIGLTQANLADAQSLQEATGIPVVLLDGSMDKIAECYRKLGEILGREARAEELSAYCEEAMAKVLAAVGGVPEQDKVTFYYAEGPQGLQTEPSSSQHALVFGLAGGANVAQVPEGSAYGMSDVSLEQVLAWDPEVIIAWSWEEQGGADQRIRASSSWAPIKAVADGRVYTMPNVPFAWLDRPPAVNRFLGLQWLANMFYPHLYDVDMVEVAQEFYELFYQIRVDAETMKGFLSNSYPPYGA